MAQLNIEDSLILVIDVQEKLINSTYNKEAVAKNAEIIAKTAHILNIPVVITEQYPKGLGNTIEGIKKYLDEAKIFEKISFSALETLDILNAIKASERKQIIIFGIESHICVNQTVTALLGQGLEVNVVIDACGSRAEFQHAAGLERMKDNGAHLITTEIALFEWLKTAKHPNFKEIQALIK